MLLFFLLQLSEWRNTRDKFGLPNKLQPKRGAAENHPPCGLQRWQGVVWKQAWNSCLTRWTKEKMGVTEMLKTVRWLPRDVL